MTLGDINTKVTELTKADTTVAYPNANRLINLNIWNQNIVTMILQSQDSSDFDDANHGSFQILTDDLVGDKRDYNFGVGEGVVEVKRVEVTYDGVKSAIATPIDYSQFSEPILNETTTGADSRFSQTYPSYEWKGNSVLIYPKPTQTLGSISVEVSRAAKDFTLSDLTTGTAQPGFDRNLHHLLAYGMSFEYFAVNGMTEQAAQMEKLLAIGEARLRKQYGRKNVEFPLAFGAYNEDYN
jgi:hypothetical protein